MPNYPQLVALVIVALVSFGLRTTVIAADNPNTTWGWINVVSYLVSAVGFVLLVFNLVLWRYLPSWLAPRPDLNGTWKVTATTWPGLGGGNPGTFSGFMFVKQYYFFLSMRLETETTSSELVAEKITVTRAGVYQLWAIYHCEPRPGVDPGLSPSHYGAMMLHIVDGDRMEGRYWIDGELRDSQGNKLQDGGIKLTDRRWKRYANYEAALTEF